MTTRAAWIARAAALLILATLALGWTAPAQAHDELEASRPENGATLDHLPKHLTMTFGEQTRPADVTVTSGTVSLPIKQAAASDTAVVVDLAGVEPAKSVVLSWKAIDAHDGHTSTGVLTFHVKAADVASVPATGSAAPTTAAPSSLTGLSRASHVVGYLAMAVLVGGLFFLAALWPEGALDGRARFLLIGSVVAGILAALASVAVELHRAGGTPRNDVLIADYGRVATAMVLIWVLAAIVVVAVLQMGPDMLLTLPWRAGALVVTIGLFRTTGMTAHATQGSAAVLGVLADFVHLGAISAWIGGLVIMSVVLLPRRRLAELEDIVPKFSKVAMISVLAVAASGLIMLYQIGTPVEGFWTSHYSRILLLKLSLISATMVAAMVSKRWVDRSLAQAVASHRSTAVRSLAASVGAETVLVIAVLSAASVLVTSSPGL